MYRVIVWQSRLVQSFSPQLEMQSDFLTQVLVEASLADHESHAPPQLTDRHGASSGRL